MVRHASEVVARRLPPSGLFVFFCAVAGLTRPPAAALLNLRRPGRLTAGRACAPGLRGIARLASRAAAPVLDRGEGGGGASSCRWKSLLLFGGAPVSAAPVVAVSRRSWPTADGRCRVRRPTSPPGVPRPRPALGVRGCSARCGGREKTGRIV